MSWRNKEKWEILESIEELLILSNNEEEQLLLINTDTEEMLFYSYGIWGVSNSDIIEYLEKLEVEEYTIESYKKSKTYRDIQEYNGEE